MWMELSMENVFQMKSMGAAVKKDSLENSVTSVDQDFLDSQIVNVSF